MQLNFRKFGNGKPLIILHGLYGSGDNWFTIGRELQDIATIYLVDQRNHGYSPHTPEIGYELLTGDIEEFIAQEKLEKVSIMGHSMGGKVAMNFALKNPEKIDKLIVIDIALKSYAEIGHFAPQALFHQNIIKTLLDLDITNIQSRTEIDAQLALSIDQKSLRQFLLKNLNRTEQGEFFWGVNLLSLRENLEKLMDAIPHKNRTFKGPTLIVSGAKSGYILEEDRRDFSEVFPNMKLKEFNTGHWVHAEEPVKIIEVLKRFLSR